MNRTSGARAPNILLVQVDQMAAPALPIHGHPLVKAPHIAALSATGVTFDNAYCNSPICAPSRFSMLSGKRPGSIDAFDNASEFAADQPTIAHYLTELGYRTTLCGKMHFVGPDQLHGFEERLVTDIYPADFAWTPDWHQGAENAPTGISVGVVGEAGPCIRSLQMDYDEEVEYHANQKLLDIARDPDAKPFFLTVSFTHPHSPYTAPQEYWDLYQHQDIDMPRVPALPLESLDTHSRWLYYSHQRDKIEVADEDVRKARHAYYGMISYIDAKVGRLLATLEQTGLRDNTYVIFVSDHGEMLGERGMWFKQTFFEWSSRVPMIISGPGIKASRVSQPVSLLDLAPTLLKLADGEGAVSPAVPWDGQDLTPLLHGRSETERNDVIVEYTDMGVCSPCRMLRRGHHKLMYTHGHPNRLYDLSNDADELKDLAGQPDTRELEMSMLASLLHDWNPEQIHQRVLESQQRRLAITRATQKSGRYPNWSFEARPGDAQRYVRGSGPKGGAAGTKARARFPAVTKT